MLKWMLGFLVLAVVATICANVFQIPAAGSVAVICFVLALLLVAGRIFERTASV